MTPKEIRSKQFDKAMSGYRTEEVSIFLADVANYVDGLLEEKNVLEQKMIVIADKLEEYREDEDSLRAALIGAHKLGENVVRESKRKAEQILAEAQQKADAMIANIRVNIDRETDVLNKMQSEVARFKGQMLSLYKQHIESINSIPYNEKDYADTSAGRQEPDLEESVSKKEDETVTAAEKPRDKDYAGKNFVVTIEEEEELEYEEVADAGEPSSKKESRHGDLQFGEKYTLTRKE